MPGKDPVQSGLFFNLNISYVGDSQLWAGEEMFMVVKEGTGSRFKGSWNFSNVNNFASHYDTSVIYEAFGADAGAGTHSFTPTTTLDSWRIYNVTAAANDFRAYLDGVLQYSTASHTFSGNANTIGYSNLPTTPLFSELFAGWVVEYILWSRQLTTDERAGALAYLQTKYGL